MRRRRLVGLGLRLGFDCGEKLGHHHFDGALDHPLADARDCAPDLNFAPVFDQRRSGLFFEIEIAGALQKTGLTLSIHRHSEVGRRSHILQLDVACEDSFDRADPGSKRGRVRVVAGFIELLAAGDASLQHRGIDQGLIDTIAAGVKFVCSFDVHEWFVVSGLWFLVCFLVCNRTSPGETANEKPETRKQKPETRNLSRPRGCGLDGALHVNLSQVAAIVIRSIQIAVDRNAVGGVS